MMEFGKLMGNEEMKRVRDAFYYMDEDANGTPRLFFDNAGGSYRQRNDSGRRI